VSANYSFLNDASRSITGPNVYGSHYRRYTFTDGVRGGSLGQASLLTVTSHATALVVMAVGSRIARRAAPPPPADVPALKEVGMDGAPRRFATGWSARNPACASCHQRMDPIGFALENFDGKWRTVSDANASTLPQRRPTAPGSTA
jgi:hypothetical protein